ncbi:SCO6745 family protein [Actinorugispora endophytica]|uniref:SalK n=1 Tax=Actinorugispora endophytica TaxID=1605990 RepID=A0A4R6UQZ3_9ACTN|nr:hypothetical protein [Actinorugispora endophytica]TDQ47983.1 hypothetical protein EV190_12042 [Actinorugispora endophytica]
MNTASTTPVHARTTWSAVEPVHLLVYFAPQAEAAYSAIGLEPAVMGYFASRSAALGAVGPGLVAAAFHSFNPAVVASVIPRAWTLADPGTVLKARLDVVDAALRAVAGEALLGSDGVAEAAELARTAALEASRHTHGRPLFAAHAGLDWPVEPHLVLWHAQSLLREYRGDGHVAALLVAGLDPVESLVTHAATGYASTRGLRRTRGWDERDWDAAVGRLTERGLVATAADGTLALTEAGTALRGEIEARTDALALPAYLPLGAEGCARLAELAAPLAETVNAAGLLPGTRNRKS